MNAFASALLCLTTHTPITTPAEFRSCECRIEVTRTYLTDWQASAARDGRLTSHNCNIDALEAQAK